jgi:hypothetical protein
MLKLTRPCSSPNPRPQCQSLPTHKHASEPDLQRPALGERRHSFVRGYQLQRAADQCVTSTARFVDAFAITTRTAQLSQPLSLRS